MTCRALAAKGPILKDSPALPLELHHVVHRPGQLAEEVFAVRFIAQDEIRIVPHQAPFVLEDVCPGCQRGPAEPSFPGDLPAERVTQGDGAFPGPETPTPGNARCQGQRLLRGVGDVEPAGQHRRAVQERMDPEINGE